MLNKYCKCGCFDSFKNQDADFIKEFEHWILYLHFHQYFFGRCLLILKKHKTAFSQLTNIELNEAAKIHKAWLKAIIKLTKKAHYSTTLTISNTESHIHNNHLHWHFIPRYENKVVFENINFNYDNKKQRMQHYNKIEIKQETNTNLRKKIAHAIKIRL